MTTANPFYTYYVGDFTAVQINAADLHAQIKALNLATAVYDGLGIAAAEDTSDPDFACQVIFIDNLLSVGEKATLDAAISAYVYEGPKTDPICYIKEVQSPGTNGGTFTSGTWQKRTLNTLVGSVDFATIASSQITLQPNTYTITARGPACDVQNHQIRLQNITTSTTQELGSSAYSTGGIMNYSDLRTTFTITVETIFELQHICYLTSANIGLGKANGWSDEIYSNVVIQKL